MSLSTVSKLRKITLGWKIDFLKVFTEGEVLKKNNKICNANTVLSVNIFNISLTDFKVCCSQDLHASDGVERAAQYSRTAPELKNRLLANKACMYIIKKWWPDINPSDTSVCVLF